MLREPVKKTRCLVCYGKYEVIKMRKIIPYIAAGLMMLGHGCSSEKNVEAEKSQPQVAEVYEGKPLAVRTYRGMGCGVWVCMENQEGRYDIYFRDVIDKNEERIVPVHLEVKIQAEINDGDSDMIRFQRTKNKWTGMSLDEWVFDIVPVGEASN